MLRLDGTSNGVELKLSTRKQRAIGNFHRTDKLHFGASLQCDAYRKAHPNALHRPVGPCQSYNCHGLTFASRRTQVTLSQEVQKILDDDDYEVVDQRMVLPGDVAVYRADARDGGEIEHSGIVVEAPAGTAGLAVPKILSKWGNCHEVVHFAYDTPYGGSKIEYYRVRI